MHELTVANSLIESIETDAKNRGIFKITKISVLVGELAGVSSGHLSFALQNLRAGTILENASIEIQQIEANATCNHCLQPFNVKAPFFECPACGEIGFPDSKSKEVHIAFYEGE